jgi:glycosyltransferase involved in cell wall biosynthesis
MLVRSTPVRLAVVTCAWRCQDWIERCLRSIQGQTYRHFRCVVVDDNSDDATAELAKTVVDSDPRFELIQNPERRFILPNTLTATGIAATHDDDVVVIVDGDDWLKSTQVFAQIADLYADPRVWLSYGNAERLRRPWKDRLRRLPNKLTYPYPAPVLEGRYFRYFPFLATHLRTYRKFLWDAVRNADLRDDTGEYFWAAGDAAAGFAMLEMAGAEHIRYIDDILYVYNNDHSWSDNRPALRDAKLKLKMQIAARQRYPLLSA